MWAAGIVGKLNVFRNLEKAWDSSILLVPCHYPYLTSDSEHNGDFLSRSVISLLRPYVYRRRRHPRSRLASSSVASRRSFPQGNSAAPIGYRDDNEGTGFVIKLSAKMGHHFYPNSIRLERLYGSCSSR